MKKQLFTLAVVLLLLAALFSTLSSCSNPKEPPQETEEMTEAEETNAATKEPSFPIFSGGAYRCAFVLPDQSTSAEFRTANQLLAFLSSHTKAKPSLIREGELDGSHEFLVLFGETDFEESKSLYQGLGAREAAAEIINGKLVIAFQSYESGLGIVNALINTLEQKPADELFLTLPYLDRYAALPTLKELPTYPNAQEIACGGDTSMRLTSTNKADFLQYCQSLEAIGFQRVSLREQSDNVFYTFLGEDGYIYAYYTAYNNEARVITGDREELAMPDDSQSRPEEHTPYIASIPQPNNGQGYILRLPDGRFLIHDGGYEGDDRVYQALRELVPEGEITIAAWFLSHPHGDHYPAFIDFINAHKNDESIRLEAVMLNLAPTDYYDVNTAERDEDCTYDADRLYRALDALPNQTQVIKLHTGQVLQFGSAEVEVLYTVEDILPQPLPNVNDTSLVIRVKMAGHSILLLADTCYDSGPIMNNIWGSYLKSDILQVAHHGQWPSEAVLYHSIQGEVLLIPAVTSRLKEYLLIKEGVSTMEAFLSYAKDLYVSCDEMQIIELPYTIQNNKNAMLVAINPNLKQ